MGGDAQPQTHVAHAHRRIDIGQKLRRPTPPLHANTRDTRRRSQSAAFARRYLQIRDNAPRFNLIPYAADRLASRSTTKKAAARWLLEMDGGRRRRIVSLSRSACPANAVSVTSRVQTGKRHNAPAALSSWRRRSASRVAATARKTEPTDRRIRLESRRRPTAHGPRQIRA
uniref:Uncharacterized protein n=1 Tax=Plectus sambesii TaxID=2011161 RepID=A0A914VQQ2_9BILA